MFKRHIMTGLQRLALAATGLLALTASAQQQFQGVCAQAKIEILQELTFERIGFEATLEITNNLGGDPITDFSAELYFRDPNDLVDSVPRDVSDKFFVQRPRLVDINAVDGTGLIGPTKTAVIRWFIIPKAEAGGSNPNGKRYEVGVRMSGKVSGTLLPKSTLVAIPDTIVVRPEPQLDINYFQPRDVQGDDPFTEEVESPIPFTLGVLVKNSGFGTARNLKIASQQPKIVENTAGLLLVAQLLGSRVQDSPLNESSLTVNLGDIGPGQTRKGAWDMITSLSGEFTEFKASYTHRDDLGGEATSLIKSLGAHFILREGINNDPGRDAILDFIADVDRDQNLLPDTLFESQGQVLPINHAPDSFVSSPLSGLTFQVTVNALAEGWGYARIADPGQAKYLFASAMRSDGRAVHPRNLWTNIRYERGTNAKLTFLNLFDKFPAPGVYTYTIAYQPPAPDTVPPVTRIRFSGEATETGGKVYVTPATQMYFTSEDASPVNIFYRTNGGAYQNGLPFRITTAGEFTIEYYAEDAAGNDETPSSVVIVLPGSGPSIASIDSSGTSLALTEDVVTFRPDLVSFTVNAGASGVPVDATVSVFRGIRSWPTLSGVPVTPTPATTATITVGGDNVDFYRYRVNGGAWSSERAVSLPFALSGLSGSVVLQVVGRSQHANFPPDNQAVSAAWTVDAAAPAWALTGLPETPTRFAIGTVQVAGAGLQLYRWRPAGSFYRAEAAPSEPIIYPPQNPGAQTLELIGRRSGTWQAEDAPSRWSWTYDPLYGSDFSSLPLVREQTFTGVQGSSFIFNWDGRTNLGEALPPGWYTVRIRLENSLGGIDFSTRLVRIDDVTSAPETLALPPVGPERPYAAGDWVTWTERGSGSPNIRARRVSNLGPVLEITNTSFAQTQPRTDGSWLVWQGQQDDGSWDVYLTNLTNPVVNTNLTTTPGFNETNPSIDWPWVVWQSRSATVANAPWQIQAYNLATAQLIQVGTTMTDQLDPDVHAGRVVWQDFRDVGFGEIYLRDLEQGTNRRITNNSFGQYKPVIRGNWIVWQDNRHTQVELYGMNLLRNVEQRLTNTTYNEGDPRLIGYQVLHSDDSLGVLTTNFRLLDLDTMRSVPLTRSDSAKRFGALSGNQIFWQGGSGASTTLQRASIPGLQPVFRNFNTVLITPEIVANFPTAYAVLAHWHEEVGVQAVSRFTSLSPLVQEAAQISGNAATGVDFPLVAGDFLWVQFPSAQVLDLGFTLAETVSVPAGISAFSFARFPVGFTGHALATSLGLGNVRALRVLDAKTGRWNLLEVSEGVITGIDFPIPQAAVVITDLVNPVSDWKP